MKDLARVRTGVIDVPPGVPPAARSPHPGVLYPPEDEEPLSKEGDLRHSYPQVTIPPSLL